MRVPRRDSSYVRGSGRDRRRVDPEDVSTPRPGDGGSREGVGELWMGPKTGGGSSLDTGARR